MVNLTSQQGVGEIATEGTRVIKRIGIAIAAMLMVGGALVVTALPAAAGTSKISSNGGMYHCVDGSTLCRTSFATAGAGEGLTMKCWRDDRNDTGAYTSNRWFYVQMDNGKVGFVHSSRVTSQTSTPNCSTNRQVTATLWATARNGQSIYVNQCLKFVHDAYLAAGLEIGSGGTANDYWFARPNQQVRTTSPNAPRGALVFWKGRPGYPEGHVAISLGNGWAMSTYERSTTVVHLMSIAERNSSSTHAATYVGWIMP